MLSRGENSHYSQYVLSLSILATSKPCPQENHATLWPQLSKPSSITGQPVVCYQTLKTKLVKSNLDQGCYQKCCNRLAVETQLKTLPKALCKAGARSCRVQQEAARTKDTSAVTYWKAAKHPDTRNSADLSPTGTLDLEIPEELKLVEPLVSSAIINHSRLKCLQHMKWANCSRH